MTDFDASQLPTQILSILPNPILVKNDALEYVWVNKAFEDLFSVSQEELVGRLDKDVFPDRQVAQCNGGDLRVLDSGEIDEAVETVFRENGEPRNTITRKIRLNTDSGGVFLLGIMHDVTDVTKANDALKASQSNLEEQAIELEKLANTDPLTGCANRNLLTSIESESLLKTDQAASLFLVDLDNFKKINDEFGHDGGDAALKHFVRLVKDNLKPSSQFLRLGGEEFGIFTKGTSKTEAQSYANELCRLVEASSVSFNDVDIRFTVSIGLCHKPKGETMTASKCLSVADKALYRAKDGGRNMVMLAA